MNENDEKSFGNDLRILSTLATSFVPLLGSHFERKKELEMTAIYKHLKTLRENGFVEKSGDRYSINEMGRLELQRLLEKYPELASKINLPVNRVRFIPSANPRMSGVILSESPEYEGKNLPKEQRETILHTNLSSGREVGRTIGFASSPAGGHAGVFHVELSKKKDKISEK